MAKISNKNYKWYILTLSALTNTFVGGIPWLCMPVLFKEIAKDLNLNLVQIGTVWGLIPLASTFVLFIGGGLADRFGVRRIVGTSCILAGVTGALRGLSFNFATLAVTMFIFGMVVNTGPMSLAKNIPTWFSRKQTGLASSILTIGMPFGFMIGSMISSTVLSPFLGGWRNVLFFYGLLSVIFGIIWLFVRTEPKGAVAERNSIVPFRESASHVARLSSIWLLGFVIAGQYGCVQGVLGYLPLYLTNIGWSTTGASAAVSTFQAVSIVGVLPIALFSDKIGRRKIVLFTTTLILAVGISLLAFAKGPLIWVAVVMAGITRDGFMAVIITMTVEAEGVSALYLGTAVGLVMTFSRASSFFSPIIGNGIAVNSPPLAFLFWGALSAAALIPFIWIKDAGWKDRKPSEYK
jgi:MFS family permease